MGWGDMKTNIRWRNMWKRKWKWLHEGGKWKGKWNEEKDGIRMKMWCEKRKEQKERKQRKSKRKN